MRVLRFQNNIILFVILTSLWVSISSSTMRQSNICGPAKCKGGVGGEKKFHYKAGNVYFYTYVINGTSSIEGGPSEQSGLHLSSKVTIKFLSACDAILFISDVEVWQSHLLSGSENHQYTKPTTRIGFRKALEEFPLRFSYADGTIEEVCPDPAESIWVLNIKRGILSSFQNTMRRLDLDHKSEEDDVHGKCKVEYRLGTATSSTLTIERIKDISSCGDKFGVMSSIQGTPYHFGTLYQSMPAVSSTSECEQIVDRNLILAVRCLESHKLASLARGAAGVYTNIVQKLHLISVYEPIIPKNETKEERMGLGNDDFEESSEDETENESLTEISQMTNNEDGSSTFYITNQLNSSIAGVINGTPKNITKRTPLLFQHDYHLSQTTNDYNTAKIALTNFCLVVKDEVSQNAGEHFEALMSVLRGLSSQDMTNLAKDASDICQGDRTPFDDTLEAVGTAASVGVIRERILKDDASVETIVSWIDSLTYIPKPDLPLLQAATEILRKRDNFPNILLSYSSLTYSFCKNHPKCGRHQAVSILSKLYDKYFAATNCATRNRKEVQQVLMYLKGIGNFGMFTPEINQALHKCITKNARTEIRVAAIEAYRRMPCDSDTTILKDLYQNQLEDAEIRIAAFLGLMKCPSYPTIRLIMRQMEAEEINQVGSFVWTYLKNLQETALPSKVELQGLLADEILTKKFSVDVRKFSRNMEISTFYDDYNLGIGLDGNLIFSQSSYIPRSATLNLTVDLFGESINVFETSFRMENFEHYVESMFGPNGKLKNNELYSIVSSLRKKRAVPSKRKLRTLSLEYDAMKRYYRDPIASFSLKTFGNEVMYKRMVGAEEQVDFMASMNPSRYFERLSNKESNWQRSSSILDSSYIIPTGVGFPLNLTAQASSIIRFQATNMIDFAINNSSPFEVKFKGKLQPSALLTVTGSITLSAFEIHTGIKVRANMRSSTAVESSIHIKGSKLVQVEFGLPKSKLEILNYRSDVLFMQGDEFRVVGDHSPPNPSCTAGIMYNYFGLKLCGSSHFSIKPTKNSENLTEDEEDQSMTPYFPLNGPAHLLLTLDKANSDLMKTKFNYMWTDDENRTRLTTTYEMTSSSSQRSTPSKVVFGFNANVDKVKQEASFSATLPSHRVDASAQISKDKSSGKLEMTASSGSTQVLESLMSFQKTRISDTKWSLEPELTVTLKNQRIIQSKGIINVAGKVSKGKAETFKGNGEMIWYGKEIKMEIEGSRNETNIGFVWDGEYKSVSSNTETIRCKAEMKKLDSNDIQALKLNDDKRQLDVMLGLELSEFPEYSLGASWKHQSNNEGFENDAELRQGNGPSLLDRNTWKIRHNVARWTNHEGSQMKWMFLITEPESRADLGFEANFNLHGKSLDSEINLRYAPGKNVQTALSLKREPGVLTHFQVLWNFTLPNQQPLHIFINIEEKAHRMHQGTFSVDWFGVNTLTVGAEYNDKSKRHRLDREVQLSVETKHYDPMKLGFHVISDDKDSKIIINIAKKILQLGYTYAGRKKHNISANLTYDGVVYLVSGDVELLHGFQCNIKTDLAGKFPDIRARLTATHHNEVQLIGIQYDWDVTRDTSKQFLFECFIDLSREPIRQAELILVYPGRNLVTGVGYTGNKEESSRFLTRQLNWDEHKYLRINANLTPRISEHEAYDFHLNMVTPFQILQNASLIVRLDSKSENLHQITVDGSWGERDTMSAIIESQVEDLENNEETDDEPEISDDDLTLNSLEEYREDDTDSNRREKTRAVKEPKRHYKYVLNGNMSSSLSGWNLIQLKMTHIQQGSFNVKTDIDVQLPNGREITVSSKWILPSRLRDILDTRAELHIKTPFIGYQNVDLQAILGQKDDSDILAIAGLYIESLQYAITIKGTPRFEDDGAMGFEITTSNAKYDKIFGSFSYATGDGSRFACQLGWPKVVIGLETGFEWNSWEEFHLYTTFTSPWIPLRNLNALAKVDNTQAEFKAEINEDGINAKCQWVIDSWETFDIRFDGSTPFEKYQKFGVVLKNSFDDEEDLESQILAWINDKQIGYEMTGGTAEVEEEDSFAAVRKLRLDIHSILYPKIQAVYKMVQRETTFNVTISLVLREGPINIGVELDLLDVFRFNEKIKITTPYAGLQEMEINLTPAVMPDDSIYNIGLHSKWRSGSNWQQGGLVIRCGPQKPLIDVLTMEAEDKAAFAPSNDPEDGGEDDEAKEDTLPKIQLNVPTSQFFHFYSPLEFAKVITFEFEDSSSGNEEDEGEENEDTKEDFFSIRSFILAYRGNDAQLNTTIQNKNGAKKWSAFLDVPTKQDRISLKLEGVFELLELEKTFSVEGVSLFPNEQAVSGTVTWTSQLPSVLEGSIEVKTPIENWEEQSIKVMYAHNEDKLSYSYDIELNSETYNKYATVVAFSPRRFSMTLETPVEGMQEVVLSAEINPREGTAETYNTLITVNSGEKEVEIDLSSAMVNNFPTKIDGTLKSSFGPSTFRNGDVSINIKKDEEAFNATGDINFKNEKVIMSLSVKMPDDDFGELDLKVDTPFTNYGQWKLWILRSLSQQDSFDVQMKAETPYEPLASIQAQFILQMDSSYLDVRKAAAIINSTSGFADFSSSWHLNEWNDFDVFSDVKYEFNKPDSAAIDNSLKFKLRNKIPDMETLTNIDSKLFWESKHPLFRIGGGVFLEIEDDSLSSKISLRLPVSAYAAELRTISNENKVTEGELDLKWGSGQLSSLKSKFNCSYTEDVDSGALHLQVINLQTVDQQLSHIPLMSIDGAFDRNSGRHTARFQVGQVQNPLVINMDVIAENIYDIESTINISSSFIEVVPQAGVRVVNKINRDSTFSGVYGGHWEEQKASITYNLDYKETNDLMKVKVEVGVEMPFQTASSANLQGLYGIEAMDSESFVRVEFNGVQLVHSNHSIKYTSSAGKESQQTDFNLDNHFWPFGFTNLYVYQYSGGYDGLNLPSATTWTTEVYDLKQPDVHKLGAELKINTNFTGRAIALTGTYPTRNLQFITEYDFLDHQFLHNTRLSMSTDKWIGYELNVMNTTKKGSTEQLTSLRVYYPLRVIHLNSGYIYQGRSLNWTTDLNLNTMKSDRKLVSVITWDETTSGTTKIHKGTLTLQHPLLSQDIQAVGELKTVRQNVGRGKHILDTMIYEYVEGLMWIDYANDSKRRLTLVMKATPRLQINYWKYWNLTTEMQLQHPVTKLDLKVYHSSLHSANELWTTNRIEFENSENSLRKSELNLEVLKLLKKLHLTVSNPEDYFVLNGNITGQYPTYNAFAELNVTGIFPLPKASVTVNLFKPYWEIYAVHGNDLRDGYFINGGVIDTRNVKFDISRSHENYRFSDVNFFLRMNNSRLITSRLKWRPEIFQEIVESSTNLANDIKDGWNEKRNLLFGRVEADATETANAIWKDAVSTVDPFVQEMRDAFNFRNDSEALRDYFQQLYEKNEFFSQDIAGFTQLFIEEVTSQLTTMVNRLNATSLDSSHAFEKTIVGIYEKIISTWDYILNGWKTETNWSLYWSQVQQNLSLFFYKCVETGVKLYEEIISDFQTYGVIAISYLDQITDKYKPAIYEFAHHIETFFYQIIVQISDYIYEARDEVMRSAYYQKLAKLAADVDQIYRDLAINDAATNIRKYYTTVKNFIIKKVSQSLQEFDLGYVGKLLSGWWTLFNELNTVIELKAWFQSAKEKIIWLADYTQLDLSIREFIVTLYTKGGNLLYQTVLQASSNYQKAKTKFIFDSDKGIISLEQKLPIPWNAFNETPVFKELPEYQKILSVQELFHSSGGSFWDMYYKMIPDPNIANWLPPLNGRAMLVGPEFFFTFDGLSYNVSTSGAYLLSADLVDSNFSVTVQYRSKASHIILVSAGHNTLIIDFDTKGLKDPKKSSPSLNLPVQMQNLHGYRHRENLIVESSKGLSVSCHMVYQICELWISGWYSRKAAGLLGAIDEEPTSDMILSNGKRSVNISAVFNSWDVSDDSADARQSATKHLPRNPSDPKTMAMCNKLFHTTLSTLQPCFATVNVNPYFEMCLVNSQNLSSLAICRSALAYVFMCENKGVTIKMPSICVRCDMNGEEMMDKEVKLIDSDTERNMDQSTDVVFIIELKDCNKNFKVKKNAEVLIKSLTEELSKANFLQNRFAVVLFGGDGVYSKPHPIVHNNQVFTNVEGFRQYLNILTTGNGSRDTFGAISYTLNSLDFRPGVSRTLILFPCSSCRPQDMSMDFSDIHYSLLEQDATLHVIMNNEFSLNNKTLSKKFLGMDTNFAYTKKDDGKRVLRGDVNLRRQIKLSRTAPGYCAPLALQSNGTVFSGRKLQNKREDIVQLFTSVFSQRVVQTAQPSSCQACYCTSEKSGVGMLKCFRCGYPRDKSLSQDDDMDDVEGDIIGENEQTGVDNELDYDEVEEY